MDALSNQYHLLLIELHKTVSVRRKKISKNKTLQRNQKMAIISTAGQHFIEQSRYLVPEPLKYAGFRIEARWLLCGRHCKEEDYRVAITLKKMTNCGYPFKKGLFYAYHFQKERSIVWLSLYGRRLLWVYHFKEESASFFPRCPTLDHPLLVPVWMYIYLNIISNYRGGSGPVCGDLITLERVQEMAKAVENRKSFN
jgi:hypothetical protein